MTAPPARGPAGGDEDPDRRAPEPEGLAEYEPAPWEPVVTRPDPMTEEEQQALLDAVTDQDAPWWLEEGDPDPQDGPAPEDCDLAEIAAQCRQISQDQARAAAGAARLGATGALAAIGAARRGPGQPGSARRFPGEYPSRAAQFATGMLFDVMPGRPELAGFADQAAGADDRFDGASDDEVLGVLCAWDRVEAHAAARKHAAVAELIRRRPGPGCTSGGPARMPAAWDEFTASELGTVLAASRWDADAMLGLAHDLEVKLPGTRAAFLDGLINQEKAEIIARATAVLDPAEARAAEALVLGRAGRLTPAGLRSAIARAVIEVAPDKARKRREEAARDARVERWGEDSGNAALAGRELPPAEGPIDPGLARDLANAAARNPATTWCVTVTDEQGHAIGHGWARPEPKSHSKHQVKRGKSEPPDGRDPPRGTGTTSRIGFAFTVTGQPGPPDGYGAWRLHTGTPGQRDLVVTLDPIPAGGCDHRYQARGHDPGVKLRYLSQIRNATCTGPGCRRPATQCDFEHNIPYEAGGRSCLCNGGPKCRHDHRLKQHPRWKVEQLPGGTFRWTTPSGRQYTTEATRYPI